MNSVNLIGYIATTPDIRESSNGKPVGSFRIAVYRQGHARNRTPDYFDITVWDHHAKAAAALDIDDHVAIEGRLHHVVWQDKDGRRQSKVEVVAHRLHDLEAATEDDE